VLLQELALLEEPHAPGDDLGAARLGDEGHAAFFALHDAATLLLALGPEQLGVFVAAALQERDDAGRARHGDVDVEVLPHGGDDGGDDALRDRPGVKAEVLFQEGAGEPEGAEDQGVLLDAVLKATLDGHQFVDVVGLQAVEVLLELLNGEKLAPVLCPLRRQPELLRREEVLLLHALVPGMLLFLLRLQDSLGGLHQAVGRLM